MSEPIAHAPPIPSPTFTPGERVDSVADGVDHPLDPRYVTLQRRVGLIGAAVRGLFLFGVAYLVIGSDMDVPVWLDRWIYAGCGLVTLALFVWYQWWPAVRYGRASYRVDAKGLEIRAGVLWRSVTTLPRSRVQHTDVSQGPFQRHFGLGTLIVHTAGTAHARVALHGLEYQRALRIREHLLPRDEHDVV